MAVGDGFRVSDVRCAGGPAGFDAPEVERGHLLVAARRGAFLRREGPTEALVDGTVAYLSARRLPERTGSGRPATAAARRRVVSQAQAALAADPRLGLVALSRVTGCSPHHLSRVFTHLTGLTVSQYRNRLRVSLALERVAEGERDLAGLAGDLGFADHAHLTRTVRAATGRTPSSLRAAFREAGCDRNVGMFDRAWSRA